MTIGAAARVGVIGAGWAGRVHAARLSADPRANVVFISDPLVAAAEKVIRELGFHAAAETDFTRAIEKHRPDAVVICSPTQSHHEQASLALATGADVLCEKPLAATRGEIVDLIARRDASERILAVSYQRRFEAPFTTARRQLLEKPDWYGEVRQIHLDVCERWSQTIEGTWRDDPRVGSGYFGDAGSHQVDAIQFVSGLGIEGVFAFSEKRSRRVEIVTQVAARMTNGAGLFAHFVGDANHWRDDLHFHAEKGDLLIRSNELTRAKDNRVEEVPAEEWSAPSDPDQAFLDAVFSRRATVSPPEVALAMFDWTAAVLNSAATGRWTKVGEA